MRREVYQAEIRSCIERQIRAEESTDGHYVCSGYLIYAEEQSGNAYWECLTKMWQSHNTAVPHDAAHGPWVAGSRTSTTA